MAHYYAFCEVHKKCGPNRPVTQEGKRKARYDCDRHTNEVDAPHGKVYVKLSSFRIHAETGEKVYAYKKIKLDE